MNQKTPSGTESWIARLTGIVSAHREMLIDVGIAFLVSRLIFYTAVVIAVLTIPEHPGDGWKPYNVSSNPLVDASFRWDTGWYLEIAEEGYDYGPIGEHSVAFFPLFPLMLRALFWVAPNALNLEAAVLLNNVIFFAALIPVWLYAARFGGRPVAQRTLLLLCIFPTAFFFNAIYTEALFLLVSATALLAMYQSRWLTAGIAGFLTSLTRPLGVLLAIPFLIQLLRQHFREGTTRLVLTGWPIALIPAGLALYIAFLLIEFGEPFAFLNVQEAWGHVQMLPTTAIYESIRYLMFTDDRDIFFVMGGVNTVLTVWALIMAAVIVRSDLLGASFAFGAILMPLIAGVESMPVVSMGRYVLVLFPLLIPMARWSSNWSIQALFIALFLPTHIMLAALFVRWYWVV